MAKTQEAILTFLYVSYYLIKKNMGYYFACMVQNIRLFFLQIKAFFLLVAAQLTVEPKEVYLSFAAILSILVVIPGITYATFSDDLITKEAIMNKNNTGLILLDRQGQEFFRFYQARSQTFVSLSDVPLIVQQAVIASEDKEFYQHSGFSVKAIIRSAIKDYQMQDFAYGGSTITQQLVKNSLLTPDKTLVRKYQEVLLSEQIESKYSKDQILEMYLNSVYFGEGAFGIANASESYFGKKVQDLDLAESAMVIGVLPAPTSFSPISGSFDQAKVRQRIVLQKMTELGYINQDQMQQAIGEKVVFNPIKNENSLDAVHFALMVRDSLINQYSEEFVTRSGFVVRTTLDMPLQQKAATEVQKQISNLAASNANNGAVVAIDPKTGEILSLVGSADWANDRFGKVNMATHPRSPGSSFKPIIYASGLEKGIITPSTILKDVPTQFKLTSNPAEKAYAPQNYDRHFRGPVTVRRALSNSLNIPAVQVMQMVGMNSGLEMAKRLGIPSLGSTSDYGLSLVLGTGEVSLLNMTSAYAVFANQGLKIQPTLITEIKDKSGAVIFSHQIEREPVLKPQVAFLISSILSDNQSRAEEFGNALTISRSAAVKTGTSDSYRDALTIGYTPSLVVGVWVGNNDNKPMSQIAGSLGAAPIWKNIMEYRLKDTTVESFTPPTGVTQVSVCSFNGLPLRNQEATSSAKKEYFMEGTVPTQYCRIPKPSSQPDAPPPNPTPQSAMNISPSVPEGIAQNETEKSKKIEKPEKQKEKKDKSASDFTYSVISQIG